MGPRGGIVAVDKKEQVTYHQTSSATNAEDLEKMYQDLGYDFKINEVDYDDTINIKFRATPLDSIRVIRSTYTPSVYVMDKEDADQGFQIFHNGSGVSVVDGTEIPLSRDHATFHHGHQQMKRVELDPGDTTFIMWDEAELLKFVGHHLGREVTTPVKFGRRFDFDRPMGSQLKGLLDYFERDVVPMADELNMPLVRANLANLFFATILSAQDNNYRDKLLTPQSPALPTHIKRARDYLDDNPHLPVTMSELVAICGVSGSSLHAGFRKYLDTSPMAYLKNRRLDGAHADLKMGDPDLTVSSIAQKWGFTHMGRFSRDFTIRFGGPPSETKRG